MQLIKVDPRALKESPDRMRQTKSTPQADALLLATIKAVGIVQPPVITPDTGGGNGYVINAGHRRVKQAIAAGLEEIDVLVDEAANDNGAMRSMVENIAREALNPVDQWRAIERLVALGWTEEATGVALALSVRQIRKLRLLANVLPATRAVTEARDATAKLANDSRDEDLDGPVGFDSQAQRKREFAADMGAQAHALRMAAEGAVAAYEQVVGETWKPFERPVDNTADTVGRKAAKAQISAFD